MPPAVEAEILGSDPGSGRAELSRGSRVMIQMQTNLDVADNSGARRVQFVKVLGGSKRMVAGLGDDIVVSVKEEIQRGRVNMGDMPGAVILRTAKQARRPD